MKQRLFIDSLRVRDRLTNCENCSDRGACTWWGTVGYICLHCLGAVHRCQICEGCGWVCEMHNHLPYYDDCPHACTCGGPGKLCRCLQARKRPRRAD